MQMVHLTNLVRTTTTFHVKVDGYTLDPRKCQKASQNSGIGAIDSEKIAQ